MLVSKRHMLRVHEFVTKISKKRVPAPTIALVVDYFFLLLWITPSKIQVLFDAIWFRKVFL